MYNILHRRTLSWRSVWYVIDGSCTPELTASEAESAADPALMCRSRRLAGEGRTSLARQAWNPSIPASHALSVKISVLDRTINNRGVK